MNRSNLFALSTLLFILGLSFWARGQSSISISGLTTVCSGSGYTYLATFYNPYNYTIKSITWSATSGNVAFQPSADQATVVWGNAGVGSVTVAVMYDSVGPNGIDSYYHTTTYTLPVTILPLPAPYITADTRMACEPFDNTPPDIQPPQFLDSPCQRVCAYSTVTYTANGAIGSTYQWTAIGGTPTTGSGPTFTVNWQGPGPGKVMVKETTVQGCQGDGYVCIDIKEGPYANLGALPDTTLNSIDVCKGTEVVFIDNSTYDPQVPLVAWRWDFGDGKYSNEKGGPWAPISHTYDVAGTYKVKLTVTNQCGCTSTDSMTIEVHPDPGVEIVCPGVVCELSTYNYTVNATCPGGTWTVIGGTVNSQSASAINITWDNIDPQTGYGYIIYNPAGSCPNMCPHPVA